MLRAIAIDDEPIALDIVSKLSAKIHFVNLLACFTNAFEAISFLQEEKVDLLFLDIRMPDISGIEFVRSLANPPMVIFTTAFSEHAVQGFELEAIDYLLKPFSLPRFLQACNRAQEQYNLRSSVTEDKAGPDIFIKNGNGHTKLELASILYAESNGNYVQFAMVNNKILSRLTMAEAEVLLQPPAFIRIHRSYIIAVQHITRIEKNRLWIGSVEIPVGSVYIDVVQKLVGLGS